jgi:hypothetical protein
MYEELDPSAFRTPPTEMGFILTVDPFKFEWPGWDLLWVRESAWSRAVKEGFKAELRDYLATMRTLAASVGYSKMAGPVTDYHFEWLAVHWFCRLSFGAISQAADRGERSLTRAERTVIHKGVRNVQKLAGITSLL